MIKLLTKMKSSDKSVIELLLCVLLLILSFCIIYNVYH